MSDDRAARLAEVDEYLKWAEEHRYWTLPIDQARWLRAEVTRLEQWIADLQSGMFINCVYCGHRYGPSPETPVAMADVLKAHIEECPRHPLSAMKAEVARLEQDFARLDQTRREIWENPEQWMRWCDHRVLERAEKATAEAAALRARVTELTAALEQIIVLGSRVSESDEIVPILDVAIAAIAPAPTQEEGTSPTTSTPS